jgi:hypothetical protein
VRTADAPNKARLPVQFKAFRQRFKLAAMATTIRE